MSDLLIQREEMDFLLWEWLGLDAVLARSGADALDRESADAILDLSAVDRRAKRTPLAG